ncbi:peptidylprolyl isomerase [Haloechinothrix sp. YIM 98757]|uniref:Peptidylprolyl isomerase n=1 Tax=Haloechinothrix aidingensis TaxID=2752311 RepID=A0A838A7M4_9PSEU|nr:peptidylprolyl isomerase [Haloechinothrix aidingensis]
MGTNEQRRAAAKRKLERSLLRQSERERRNKRLAITGTVTAVVVAAGLLLFFVIQQSGNQSAADEQEDGETSEAALDIPAERVAAPERPTPLPDPQTCEYDTGGDASDSAVTPPDGDEVPAEGTVDVVLESTAGDIPLTLDRALAPCTVNSLVNLIEQDFYDDTACHRLGTAGLQMLQCGDPKGDGTGGPGYTIPDENFDELRYGRGLLAMARTAEPDSGGSQFFMVYGEAELPPEYTVFGTVSDSGLEVLDSVARDGVASPGPDGTGEPNTEVRFTDVTIDT